MGSKGSAADSAQSERRGEVWEVRGGRAKEGRSGGYVRRARRQPVLNHAPGWKTGGRQMEGRHAAGSGGWFVAAGSTAVDLRRLDCIAAWFVATGLQRRLVCGSWVVRSECSTEELSFKHSATELASAT
eukprot:365771-Chlamydomonas_euryale.AAC.1